MTRGGKIGLDALEEKIEKGKDDVTRAKARYDEATANLKLLLDKRDTLHTKQLLSAITKSDKSFEEIIYFITSGSKDDE